MKQQQLQNTAFPLLARFHIRNISKDDDISQEDVLNTNDTSTELSNVATKVTNVINFTSSTLHLFISLSNVP